ncbi:MAG: hypothetical protein IJ123_07695 [Blautia sp.]|nr:hypothetical protein [Blautia sp.]
MNEAFLGIDLGTSSVKAVLVSGGRSVQQSSAAYPSQDMEGYKAAVVKALDGISGKDGIAAVGLSSQTGTYVVNDKYILPWKGKEGMQELLEIKNKYSREVFLRETGMDHPELTSYPLPKLLYGKRKLGEIRSFCQLKDMICEMLTGKKVSDPFTWRGLANTGTCVYSDFLLEALGINKEILPPLMTPWDIAGKVTPAAERETGLRAGTPVYTGLNDYFAALLGIGAVNYGDWFDITGTSEHLGCIEKGIISDTQLISGPYITGFVHYGVTASTGDALSFGRRVFAEQTGTERLTEEHIRNAPVFLPYLSGRRSPCPDPGALGSFNEIRGSTGPEDMAYSVLEGVAFSLYHIFDTVEKESSIESTADRNRSREMTVGPEEKRHLRNEDTCRPGEADRKSNGDNCGPGEADRKSNGDNCGSGEAERKSNGDNCRPDENDRKAIRVCGGAAVNPVLNRLKAELFGAPLLLMEEKNASAFGAALAAMIGEGAAADLSEVREMCRISDVIYPEGKLRDVLMERYRRFLEYAGFECG